MKTTSLLSLAAVCLLAQCNKTPQAVVSAAPVTPAVPSVPLITENASPHFMKVASHLELGGASFNYADQEGLVSLIATLLDEALKSVPEEQRKDLPKDFSVTRIFKELGLDSVKAVGGSSRRLDSGNFHSRTYAYMPGGRKGLMTLNGGLAEPFLIHQTAPKGTDLSLEFPIHLKTLGTETLNSFLGMVPEKARAEAEAPLAQPIPTLGITMRELIEKLDARLALHVKVYPEQQLILPSAEFPLPGMDALLVADRIGWLLEPLKKQFMPMLSNPALPVEVIEKDGILTISMRAPVGPAPMDFQPVLRFDSKTDRLLLATRPAFLATAVEGKELVTSDAEFKAAWTGLPEKGNSAIYLSPTLLKTLRETALKSVASSEESEDYKNTVSKVLNFITPYLDRGQAACSSNEAEGTLGVANLAIAMSDSSTLGAISYLAVVSSMAVPTFNLTQEKARQMKVGNEGRQIGLALMKYALEHNGTYPATLDVLTSEGLLDETILNANTTWLYNPTLTNASPDDAILLASEPSTQGKPVRVVVRKSGISETIPEVQFEVEKDENLR